MEEIARPYPAASIRGLGSSSRTRNTPSAILTLYPAHQRATKAPARVGSRNRSTGHHSTCRASLTASAPPTPTRPASTSRPFGPKGTPAPHTLTVSAAREQYEARISLMAPPALVGRVSQRTETHPIPE